MFDSTVNGLCEGRRLCHLQSCDFLFMCFSGNGPTHNGSLQSTVSDTHTHRGSDYVSLHSHPVAMNKCCLWTFATVWASDHAGLPLLLEEMLCIVCRLVTYFGSNSCHLKRGETKINRLTTGWMVCHRLSRWRISATSAERHFFPYWCTGLKTIAEKKSTLHEGCN